MRSGAPFRTYVTASNLAFLVLVFRHYISRWKWEAARKRSKMAGLKRMKNEEEGDKPQLYYSGGLASKPAKAAFLHLQDFFQTWFYMKNSTKAAENMSLLSRAVHKIGLPSKFIVVPPKRTLSDDDIVGDVVHSVFYQLHF